MRIEDLAPTILYLFGIPTSKNIDGKVISEVFEGNMPTPKRKFKNVMISSNYSKMIIKERVIRLRSILRDKKHKRFLLKDDKRKS